MGFEPQNLARAINFRAQLLSRTQSRLSILLSHHHQRSFGSVVDFRNQHFRESRKTITCHGRGIGPILSSTRRCFHCTPTAQKRDLTELKVGHFFSAAIQFPKILVNSTRGRPTLQIKALRAIYAEHRPNGNYNTLKRRPCLLYAKDHSTLTVLVCTSQPPAQLSHRFAPFNYASRLAGQPPAVLHSAENPESVGGGYIFFTHALVARLVEPQSIGGSFRGPGGILIKHYNIDTGDMWVPSESYRLSADQMAYIEDLHKKYWEGVRYDENGKEIESVDEDEVVEAMEGNLPIRRIRGGRLEGTSFSPRVTARERREFLLKESIADQKFWETRRNMRVIREKVTKVMLWRAAVQKRRMIRVSRMRIRRVPTGAAQKVIVVEETEQLEKKLSRNTMRRMKRKQLAEAARDPGQRTESITVDTATTAVVVEETEQAEKKLSRNAMRRMKRKQLAEAARDPGQRTESITVDTATTAVVVEETEQAEKKLSRSVMRRMKRKRLAEATIAGFATTPEPVESMEGGKGKRIRKSERRAPDQQPEATTVDTSATRKPVESSTGRKRKMMGKSKRRALDQQMESNTADTPAKSEPVEISLSRKQKKIKRKERALAQQVEATTVNATATCESMGSMTDSKQKSALDQQMEPTIMDTATTSEPTESSTDRKQKNTEKGRERTLDQQVEAITVDAATTCETAESMADSRQKIALDRQIEATSKDTAETWALKKPMSIRRIKIGSEEVTIVSSWHERISKTENTERRTSESAEAVRMKPAGEKAGSEPSDMGKGLSNRRTKNLQPQTETEVTDIIKTQESTHPTKRGLIRRMMVERRNVLDGGVKDKAVDIEKTTCEQTELSSRSSEEGIVDTKPKKTQLLGFPIRRVQCTYEGEART